MADKFIDRPSVPGALTLGAAILLTGIIFSYAFYSARQSEDTISVTGSAKQEVKADSAKWTIEAYRVADDGAQAGAYALVAKDVDAIKRYFKAQGIDDSAIAITIATADQQYNNNGPTTYRVHEEVTLTLADVEKVQALAQSGALVAQGLSVNPQQPEYYISNLPDLRVSLLGQAVADAKARAQEIAKSGGSSVGKLSGASSGVVQVTAPNSTNVDDYGSYDTSTIQKEVSVTARATFVVR